MSNVAICNFLQKRIIIIDNLKIQVQNSIMIYYQILNGFKNKKLKVRISNVYFNLNLDSYAL